MLIHVTDIMDSDVLKEDVFNSYGLHILSKHTILHSKEISKLIQHSIEYVEIVDRSPLTSNDLQDLDQLERTLESTATPKWVPHMTPIYNTVVKNVKVLFDTARVENKINSGKALSEFDPLIDNLSLERDVVSLLLLLNNSDSYTYQHSVQVGMLSYYIANWIGLSDDESIKVGHSGFLHDIGKCKIDQAILNKPGKLTSEEFDEVKRHTLYGYEIIQNSTEDADIALGALDHHERMDGSGYPNSKKGEDISLDGRIIAVADIYSAMISSRVYQKERDLLFVLRELYRLSFNELDPVITHSFIAHMIPNFIGKRVTLNDGRTGMIVMTHPTEYFSPLIKVGSEFIDLTQDRSIEIMHVYF